jgi:hypothetical protein
VVLQHSQSNSQVIAEGLVAYFSKGYLLGDLVLHITGRDVAIDRYVRPKCRFVLPGADTRAEYQYSTRAFVGRSYVGGADVFCAVNSTAPRGIDRERMRLLLRKLGHSSVVVDSENTRHDLLRRWILAPPRHSRILILESISIKRLTDSLVARANRRVSHRDSMDELAVGLSINTTLSTISAGWLQPMAVKGPVGRTG